MPLPQRIILPLTAALTALTSGPLFVAALMLSSATGRADQTFEAILLALLLAMVGAVGALLLIAWLRSAARRQAEAIRRRQA
jgi:hypothetical protein